VSSQPSGHRRALNVLASTEDINGSYGLFPALWTSAQAVGCRFAGVRRVPIGRGQRDLPLRCSRNRCSAFRQASCRSADVAGGTLCRHRTRQESELLTKGVELQSEQFTPFRPGAERGSLRCRIVLAGIGLPEGTVCDPCRTVWCKTACLRLRSARGRSSRGCSKSERLRVQPNRGGGTNERIPHGNARDSARGSCDRRSRRRDARQRRTRLSGKPAIAVRAEQAERAVVSD
jgi:hypothetical protein